MNRYDSHPLTYKFPRTLRDTERDPSAWWASAEAAAAEEQHIRAMFAEPARRARMSSWDRAHLCIYVIAAGVAVAFMCGAFR